MKWVLNYHCPMFTRNNVLISQSSIFCSQNVLEIYRHLPNVILLEENQHKLFTHLDFLWAIDIKILLYDRLIELLQKFDNDV